KSASIHGLTTYIAAPGKDEKALHIGTRGFLSATLPGQQKEMVALAMEAPRSKDPVAHYILSWREGEQPTPQQVDQAVDIALEELGLRGHQTLYALHQDTDNLHVHLAVNRVHPETHRMVAPNKGFDVEAIHRALARIEAMQGWKPEANAR